MRIRYEQSLRKKENKKNQFIFPLRREFFFSEKTSSFPVKRGGEK